jgi:PAS domain S-box-containing protein
LSFSPEFSGCLEFLTLKKRSTPKRRSRSSPPAASPASRSALDKVFPIVGIGASAGGLEAFSTLLANLPETTGMAYVFLQPLDPSHHSAFEEILSRIKITVTQATDGIEVRPNHIYLVPPNSDMVIGDGILRLSPRTLTHDQHSPIDSRAYADAVIETARDAVLILDANLRVMVANPAFYSSFQVGPEETVNRHIFDLGDRQWDIPVLRTLLENITRKNAPVDDFEVRHKFEHIGDRLMVLNARRIESSGGKPLIFFSIDDVTERRKSKGALERQAALLNLAHDTVIVRTLAGEILFWNRGAEEMYGWTKEEALGKTTHQLLHTEFPCSFAEVEKDLRNTGRWEGELVHTTKTGERRTVDSRWVIQQNEAELVILEINTDISDRKQSEETLRRLSAYLMTLQDEERRRIARELHDSTGQKLAAAKLQLDSLVKSGNVKSYEKIIAEATQWIDECFQEVRTLSQLLHPPLLDEAGLLSATRWMVDGFSARANIQVDFQITAEFGRLPQPVELALFRVVQESLSNIRRHSGATKAQITLTRNDGSVRLEISDNGKGIPPQSLAKSGSASQVVGVGILGMRERLNQLGGQLDIDSSQAGTTVKVSVPVAAAATR